MLPPLSTTKDDRWNALVSIVISRGRSRSQAAVGFGQLRNSLDLGFWQHSFMQHLVLCLSELGRLLKVLCSPHQRIGQGLLTPANWVCTGSLLTAGTQNWVYQYTV